MTEPTETEYDRVFPIEVSEGDDVGECPNCGPVVRDDVEKDFPVANCGICGSRLRRATTASHDTRITQPRGGQRV